MPTRPLDRLMFAQGGLCFFCRKPLPKAEASIEHLVASANGGGNNDENCVACCTSLNALFGRMSLKEKLQVVLNQKGQFKCPNGVERHSSAPSDRFSAIVENLRQRGSARPRSEKTLRSTIASLFQGELSPAELSAEVERLRTEGIVTINGVKVTYAFPEQGAQPYLAPDRTVQQPNCLIKNLSEIDSLPHVKI